MTYARRMDIHMIYYVLAGILILAGLAGTILPALPGVPLVFAGMLLAAWADHFTRISVWTIVLLALLTALSVLVDVFATALGAKRVGACKLAMAGAAVGTLAGIFFGLPGLIVGPFAGAVGAELIGGRKLAHASKIGFGTWMGLALGTAFKVALAFAMLGVFALALIF
jgi:uncharacterized protein YqgC (DUF456 family)